MMSGRLIEVSGTRRNHHLAIVGLTMMTILVTACATPKADMGFGPVQQSAREALNKEVEWVRDDAQREQVGTRVAELLAEPLSIDAAVQIALLNNRGLQADFETLGITEAERVQAGRLPNPGFSFGRSSKGDEREIERGIHFNLAKLIFMPTVMKLENRRVEQMQRQVVGRILDLASQTRKAWIDAVSARETLVYMDQVKRTADVGAQLARRMAEVGNFNKLQQAREQSFYADASVNLARAKLAADVARERLTRVMGLFGEQINYQLPQRLPDLPKEPEAGNDLVKRALNQRLDVQGAQMAVDQLGENLGMVRTNRFINVLEIGGFRNSSNEEPTQTGWEIDVELPIFDWGGAKVARAEGLMRQAMNAAAQTAIEASSEVRQAYITYRTAYDIAKQYRDEIVPLRQRIAEENLYRYNGMFIGVFALLADARAQVAAVDGYINALREFWTARADLDMAMVGKPALAAMGTASMADTGGAGDADH